MKIITVDQVIYFNKRACHDHNHRHVILNSALIESALGSAFFNMEGVGYIHGEIPEIAAALCYKITRACP
jgi:hypothetical protein